MVFPDGDEFHLRRDDAGAGVGELSHHFAFFRAKDFATRCRQAFQPERRFILPFRPINAAMFFREITVINRLYLAPGVFLNITPF